MASPDPYAPFERHDRYGKMGMAPQTTLERIRLCIAAVTVLPVRAAGTLACVVGFFAACKLLQLLPSQYRSPFVAALGKAYCKACLLCIGFWRVRWLQVPRADWDARPAATARAAAIVSNHCSWADILVHMSHSFPSFVARKGTDALPLIGFIRWRCLFRVPAMPTLLPSVADIMHDEPFRCVAAASRWTASL